jgi:adenine-specific DNA-methyltransferase
MNIIKIDKQHDLEYSGFKLQKTGLMPIGNPTFEQWQECGQFIQKASGAVQLWLGDWLNYGEHKWGEKYAQAIEDTGLEYGSLRNAAYVAKQIDLSRRRDNLPFSHHQEVASLEPDKQTEVLDWAEEENATVREVRQKVRDVKRDSQLKSLNGINQKEFAKKVIHGECISELKKLSDKSIDLIYVDPPYNVGKGEWDNFSDYDFKVFIIEWLKQCLRVIKDKSHLFINFDSDKAAWLETLIAKEFGIYPASRIIWHYRNAGGKSSGKFKFSKTYEPILHYAFGDKPLNFPIDWDDKRFDVWVIAIPQVNFEGGKDHPTQKPLELMERLVEFGSMPGELVLDPMAGSGTTGVAAQKLNRDFILIENNKDYINVIKKRLSI